MAKVLATSFSIDLSVVVKSSIAAVKLVRSNTQAKREAEFQRAIANGLSYEEQIRLRQKWLDEEKASSFVDENYIAVLEKSIADTKKLNRFNNYRTKYTRTLKELSAGKINEEQYLSVLEQQLSGVEDPELRLEIQNDIREAVGAVKNYHDTILKNQVVFATKDGTATVLKDVIARVTAARTEAVINDNQDEVTAHDETLLALTSQLNTANVEDEITNFQVKSSTLGVSPIEKLSFINRQIQDAKADSLFRIDGKTYSSAREFWTLERDNYLAGESQTLGGNFFEELNVFTNGEIQKDNAKFGYTTQEALNDVIGQYNKLSGQSEMTPFLGRLDSTRTSALGSVISFPPGFAPPVPTPAGNAGAPPIKTTPTPLATPAAAPVAALAAAPAAAPTDEETPPVPERIFPTPTGAPIPTPATTTTVAPASPAPSSTQNPAGSPQFTPATGIGTKSDDGKFVYTATGWKAAPPIQTPIPASMIPAPKSPQYTPASGIGTKSEDGKFIYQKGGWQPITEVTPQSNTASAITAASRIFPTPTGAAPVPPKVNDKPQSSYTGSSVVDYLKSIGLDSSAANRARLAVEKGVVQSEEEYLKAAKTKSNAMMNTKLLDSLRKSPLK